jgi:lysophospholipase L1-like esterase
MLRAKGYDVTVGVTARAGSTSDQILGMVQSAVTPGTRVVVFSSGGANDLARGGSIENLKANTAAIKAAIRAKGAVPIQVFPKKLPAQYLQPDRIHTTAQGNAVVAAGVLPRVIAAIGKR